MYVKLSAYSFRCYRPLSMRTPFVRCCNKVRSVDDSTILCTRGGMCVGKTKLIFYPIVTILYGRRILLRVPEYILLRHHHVSGQGSLYI